MALRNIATRNTANTLQEIGLAKIGKGDGPTGKSVIRFREHGADRFATIDTDTIGIPPELVVHGLDGIATQLPAALKLLGVPARMLRHFIVRNPVYAFRQVFRDSVANVLIELDPHDDARAQAESYAIAYLRREQLGQDDAQRSRDLGRQLQRRRRRLGTAIEVVV